VSTNSDVAALTAAALTAATLPAATLTAATLPAATLPAATLTSFLAQKWKACCCARRWGTGDSGSATMPTMSVRFVWYTIVTSALLKLGT
jgi:hypothetical protein